MFFKILKALKPMGHEKTLLVEPGRISAPWLGLTSEEKTGITEGAWVAKLDKIPAAAKVLGVDGDALLLEIEKGVVQRLTAEEGSPFDLLPVAAEAATIPVPEKKTLDWLLSAAGRDPARAALVGIHFSNRSAIATDGHRLHEARIPDIGLAEGFTLPRNVAGVLAQANDWRATPDRSWLSFGGDVTLCVEHLQSSYPDVAQVYPSQANLRDFPRVQLDAVEAHKLHADAAKLRGSANSAVLWEPSDHGLDISLSDQDLSWKKRIQTSAEGFPKTGYNPKYIAECLKGTKGTVLFAAGDSLGPTVIGLPGMPGCEKRRALIMPMRVQ